jgi:hypothetical protein
LLRPQLDSDSFTYIRSSMVMAGYIGG